MNVLDIIPFSYILDFDEQNFSSNLDEFIKIFNSYKEYKKNLQNL